MRKGLRRCRNPLERVIAHIACAKRISKPPEPLANFFCVLSENIVRSLYEATENELQRYRVTISKNAKKVLNSKKIVGPPTSTLKLKSKIDATYTNM
jgi:hypothetical protein